MANAKFRTPPAEEGMTNESDDKGKDEAKGVRSLRYPTPLRYSSSNVLSPFATFLRFVRSFER
jgi:hypothetical protein